MTKVEDGKGQGERKQEKAGTSSVSVRSSSSSKKPVRQGVSPRKPEVPQASSSSSVTGKDEDDVDGNSNSSEALKNRTDDIVAADSSSKVSAGNGALGSGIPTMTSTPVAVSTTSTGSTGSSGEGTSDSQVHASFSPPLSLSPLPSTGGGEKELLSEAEPSHPEMTAGSVCGPVKDRSQEEKTGGVVEPLKSEDEVMEDVKEVEELKTIAEEQREMAPTEDQKTLSPKEFFPQPNVKDLVGGFAELTHKVEELEPCERSEMAVQSAGESSASTETTSTNGRPPEVPPVLPVSRDLSSGRETTTTVSTNLSVADAKSSEDSALRNVDPSEESATSDACEDGLNTSQSGDRIPDTSCREGRESEEGDERRGDCETTDMKGKEASAELPFPDSDRQKLTQVRVLILIDFCWHELTLDQPTRIYYLKLLLLFVFYLYFPCHRLLVGIVEVGGG